MSRVPAPLVLMVLMATGCPDCPGPSGEDAGTTTSSSGGGGDAGNSDAGRRDGGARDGGDGGFACGPETPGFGEACGDCGVQACNPAGQLVCQDPGKNACDVCGQLDNRGGIVGRTCGTCGIVGCADGGLVTECQGEHPPNDCGGCQDFPLLGGGRRDGGVVDGGDGGMVTSDGGFGTPKGPPDGGCSLCGTGTWACMASLNDLSCWGGRAPDNACNSCNGRCIQHHADMADLSQGAFIRAGTRAIIEDVGTDLAMRTSASAGTKILTFEPLITGPGGLVMEAAIVYLSPTERQDDPNAFALQELFGAYSFGELGDPVRQYLLYPRVATSLPTLRHVIIYDGFLQQVVSRGRLVAGPPPGP